MSKLVKLSTTLDTNRNTNGYLCISDNDIILEPNAKVSLLNAHLSSGIVTDYKIAGVDSDNLKTGKAVLSADLNDGVIRNVIVENGNYDINGLLQQIQDGLNSSMVYQASSSVTATSKATGTLVVPTDQSFALAHTVGLDSEKVKISYNSVTQKAPADMQYSVKDPVINVDPDGTLTYGGGPNPPPAFIGLITNQANNGGLNNVLTNGPAAPSFAVNNAVVLVDNVNQNTVISKISQITTVSDSLASQLAVDPTAVDPLTGNPYIDTDKIRSAAAVNDIAADMYKVGQDISLDDGTSTFGNLQNNIKGELVRLARPYVNESHSIRLLDSKKVDTSSNRQAVVNTITKKPNSGGGHSFTLIDSVTCFLYEAEFNITLNGANQAADEAILGTYGIAINNLGFMSDGTNIIAIVSITDITYTPSANPGVDPATAIIQLGMSSLIDGVNITNIDIADFRIFTTAQTWSSTQFVDDPQVGQQTYINGMKIGFADVNGNIYGYNTITNIANPTQNKMDFTFGSDVTNNVCYTTFNGFKGLRALKQIYTELNTSIGWDSLTLRPLWYFITVKDTNIADVTIAPNDNCIIDETAQLAVKITDVQQVRNKSGTVKRYVIFGIDDTALTTAQTLAIFDNSSSPIPNPATMVKTDLTKYLVLELNNLNGALDNTKTRLWIGDDIVFTSKVDLSGLPIGFDLTKFNEMIKGVDSLPKNQAFAIEDSILNHSSGRAQWFIKTPGLCEFGIIPDSTPITSGLSVCPIRIILTEDPNSAGDYYYKVKFNNADWDYGRNLRVFQGDWVVLQWGVTGNAGDFEYVNRPASADDANTALTLASLKNATANYNNDKNKCLISVIRSGPATDSENGFIYLGCPADDVETNDKNFGFRLDADEDKRARTIPWTPREDPYLPAIMWNNRGDYHVYVSPNNAEIQTLELSPPGKFTTLASGEIAPISGNSILYHPDMHEPTNLNADYTFTKFNSLTNNYTLTWLDATIGKILGYKLTSTTLTGLMNNWTANLDYLRAYLPEGLVILLENINAESYDLGQYNGGRRNILATCVDTQDKQGEISVEPANLYRIGLGNTQPINLRKFALSFEDLYGNRLLLANAKVTVCLLFE